MNTQITQTATGLLRQLIFLVEGLTDEQYINRIPVLSKASIGQHTRHIIEFFLELEKGYHSGIVNYDARKRDDVLETQRSSAAHTLRAITARVEQPDKSLLLSNGYAPVNTSASILSTSYLRELLYAIEHTVHHMALLRIGVNIVSDIELPENFGVAASTIKYRNQCAQ